MPNAHGETEHGEGGWGERAPAWGAENSAPTVGSRPITRKGRMQVQDAFGGRRARDLELPYAGES